ncbi:hypothetical protein PC116_g13787 [Phytophthora cactorum]|nr:hypothetical protein PC116_g13787 [Phytophthora cactorum]
MARDRRDREGLDAEFVVFDRDARLDVRSIWRRIATVVFEIVNQLHETPDVCLRGLNKGKEARVLDDQCLTQPCS